MRPDSLLPHLGVALLVASTACGDRRTETEAGNDETSTTAMETTEATGDGDGDEPGDGDGDEPGDGDGDDTGDGDGDPGPCVPDPGSEAPDDGEIADGDWRWDPVDPLEPCPNPCPVLQDFALTIGTSGLPTHERYYGAIPTADGLLAWLIDQNLDPTGLRVFELVDGVITPDTVADGFRFSAVVADDEGTIVALSDELLRTRQDDATWKKGPVAGLELIPISEEGIQVDPSGGLHAWTTDGHDEGVYATRLVNEDWVVEPFDSVYEEPRFSLTPTGERLGYAWVESNDTQLHELRAILDDQTYPFGPKLDPFQANTLYYDELGPSHPAMPDAEPVAAAVIQAVEGLYVAWPDFEGGKVEWLLPGTEHYPVETVGCDYWRSYDDCTGPCSEQHEGVERGGARIARTSDGRIWVAWIHTDYSSEAMFEKVCGEDMQCFSDTNFDIQLTLTLTHIPTNGDPPADVFELPLGQGQVRFYSRRDIEMFSYGSRLGIAIPTFDEGELLPGPFPAKRYVKMRAIEIETNDL